MDAADLRDVCNVKTCKRWVDGCNEMERRNVINGGSNTLDDTNLFDDSKCVGLFRYFPEWNILHRIGRVDGLEGH